MTTRTHVPHRLLAVVGMTAALLASTVSAADALQQLKVKNLVSPALVNATGKTVTARFHYSCVTKYTSASVTVSQSRGPDGYGSGVTFKTAPITCDGTVRLLRVAVPISTGVVKPGHVDVDVAMSGFLRQEIISSSLGETINVIRG